MDPLEEYTWIVVFGAIAATFTAFGIGANDVANAYATSVGSKALTIKQACVLAVVFEFLGAVLAGSSVSETIRKGVVDVGCYDGYMDAAILMYGNLCVVGAVGIWLLLATYLEMPVSTTHSCVGGLIGMGLVTKGGSCITWYKEPDNANDKFLPGGVTGIVLSWVFSPVLSGVMAVIIYSLVRRFVLRSADSFNRAIKVYPILIFCAVWINAFFVISKGIKKKICPSKYNIWICRGWDDSLSNGADTDANGDSLSKSDYPGKVHAGVAAGVAAALAVFAALVCWPLYGYIRKLVDAEFSEAGIEKIEAKKKQAAARAQAQKEDLEGATGCNRVCMQIKEACAYSINRDVHMVKDAEDASIVVKNIHEHAEKFDAKTEAVFRYIQIFTAICDSFAHGANDVANAMGPFMAIWVVWQNEGDISKKTDIGDDAYWILAIGGVGIGLGLLLYGYKIIQAIGVKLAVITPSRGFAIELGAATIIILGSYMGLPLSTTHCQVGATTGVALLEGSKGINKFVLGKTAFGWVITLVVAGFGAAVLTAQGIHAPLAGGIDEPKTAQGWFMAEEAAEYMGMYSPMYAGTHLIYNATGLYPTTDFCEAAVSPEL